jgi:hypothetical protein
MVEVSKRQHVVISRNRYDLLGEKGQIFITQKGLSILLAVKKHCCAKMKKALKTKVGRDMLNSLKECPYCKEKYDKGDTGNV